MTEFKTKDLLYIAVFSALMAACAWISVPWAIPFTMQTFAVFLAAAVLGGKRAATAVAVYILAGAFGMPVFSGGRAGAEVIFSQAGGYLLGFLPCAYIAGKLCEKTKKRPLATCLSLFAGLLCDYILGALWLLLTYSKGGIAIGMVTLLFLLPDIAKILLAYIISIRFQKI